MHGNGNASLNARYPINSSVFCNKPSPRSPAKRLFGGVCDFLEKWWPIDSGAGDRHPAINLRGKNPVHWDYGHVHMAVATWLAYRF